VRTADEGEHNASTEVLAARVQNTAPEPGDEPGEALPADFFQKYPEVAEWAGTDAASARR